MAEKFDCSIKQFVESDEQNTRLKNHTSSKVLEAFVLDKEEVDSNSLLWYEDFIKALKNWDVSLLDFFSARWVDKKSFVWILNYFVGENIYETENGDFELSWEWVEIINEYFNEAVDFYQNELFCNIPSSFFKNFSGTTKNLRFRSFQDVFNFVEWKSNKWSNRSSAYKQIQCSLTKIVMVLLSVKTCSEAQTSRSDLERIIRDKLFADENFQFPFDESELKDSLLKDIIKTKTFSTNYFSHKDFENKISAPYEVQFSLIWRSKEDQSTIMKMITQPDYLDIDLIRDHIWFKAEVNSEEEALFLLQYVYYIFNWNELEDIDIKNKGILDEKTLNKNRWYLNDEFLVFLEEGIVDENWNVKDSRKSRTNKNYKDIKITFKVLLGDRTTWVEFQIVLVNNKNETWFSSHKIMDALRRIETLIRLEWYITRSRVRKIIKKMIENEPDLISIWKQKWVNREKMLENAVEKIYNHFIDQGNIVKMNIPEAPDTIYYTTPKNWQRLKNMPWYPDGAQIKKDWKRISK